MANRFKDNHTEAAPDISTSPQSNNDEYKLNNNVVISYIHKIFIEIFAGRFLKKLNLVRNWKYFSLIVFLIITFIYNNLNIHAQRKKINKLNSDLIIAGDRMMDAVEDSYLIDEEQWGTILDSARRKGFESGIPFEIKTKQNQ
jgi:F0F1-type ATP synthase assembly protein I